MLELRYSIDILLSADLGSKESPKTNSSIDETKQLPLRASKRRASQDSSGSNGSSKEAKRMLNVYFIKFDAPIQTIDQFWGIFSQLTFKSYFI